MGQNPSPSLARSSSIVQEMMLPVNGDRCHSFMAMIALAMGIAAIVVIFTVDNESALSSMDPLIENEASETIKAELKALERDANEVQQRATLSSRLMFEAGAAKRPAWTTQLMTVEAPKKVKKVKKKMKKAKKKMKKAKKAKKKLEKAAGKGGKAGVKAMKKLNKVKKK